MCVCVSSRFPQVLTAVFIGASFVRKYLEGKSALKAAPLTTKDIILTSFALAFAVIPEVRWRAPGNVEGGVLGLLEG
jgi:hypothetical protein